MHVTIHRVLSLALIGLLSLSPQAWAFPDNGILDIFTGTDGTSPPNGNWTNGAIYGAAAGLQLDNNQVTSNDDNGDRGGYWSAAAFSSNLEAYVTYSDLGSTTMVSVCGRLANIGNNTTDGYCVEATDGTSNIDIVRVDNGVATTLGASISQTITVGDRIGLKAVGDQICAWFSDNGGAWTQLGCRTDSTYIAGGNIGLSINGTTTVGAADDFGGGSILSKRKFHVLEMFP